jgi:Bacterial capsule synthesis protein PGA_cap
MEKLARGWWRLAVVALVWALCFDGSAGAEPELVFRDACAIGKRATVAAVGDLLFNRRLQREALTEGRGYRNFWQPVEKILSSADVTYANLEGVVAEGITYDGELVAEPGRRWNNRVYGAPDNLRSFSYHPSLLDDLKASGVDVLSTANNHALDRGWLGVDRTIDNIAQRGLALTGTRKRHGANGAWSVTTPANGLSVAWLACSYGTNGRPDFHGQVLLCYRDRNWILAEIRRLAALSEVDAVIFTPHWGVENTTFVLLDQIDLAGDVFAAGATAIIGTHPHVLQRWDKLTDGDGREGLVIYSTGDFISDRRHDDRRRGLIAWLELVKEAGEQKARISAAGYVPTSVRVRGGYRVVEVVGENASDPLPRGNRLDVSRADPMPRGCALSGK